MVADLALQVIRRRGFPAAGVPGMYSLRWFRSRPISVSLCQDHRRDRADRLFLRLHRSAAVERSLARRDSLRRPAGPHRRRRPASITSTVVGAYLICIAVIAVALYLSTAFSFGAIRIWSQTRFGFAYAALDRFTDWRMERARKQAAKDLEKKRAPPPMPSQS